MKISKRVALNMDYKIADHVITLKNIYPLTQEHCKDYIYNGQRKSEAVFSITPDYFEQYYRNYPAEIKPQIECEELANLFYIWLLKYNATCLHASCVVLDNEAYIFTAPCGTGKSTHARLWCEHFPKRAVIINDDKPILTCQNDIFFAHGAPWCGKEGINSNTYAKIKGICVLHQGSQDKIKKLLPSDGVMPIMNQILLPYEQIDMEYQLDFISRLLENVPIYDMICTISHNAVLTSYNAMK